MSTNNLIAFPMARARGVAPLPAETKPAKKRRYKVKGAPKPKDYAPEAGWRRLSGKQKAKLAMLAREAAGKQFLPVAGAEFDAWRQEQAIAACGLRISEACQRDWSDLLVHFESLCGRAGEAFQVALRSQDNGHRIAMFKLREALKERGLDEGYAETICRSKFKCTLRDAEAKQVWTVVYDVRERRKNASLPDRRQKKGEKKP